MTWGRVRGFAIALMLALVPAAVAADEPPDVVGSAYVVVDGPTGEVLASRAADQRQAMASTTKLMTALVVLAEAELDDTITIASSARVGESTAGLVAGEELAVGDLLTALLVGSGNDAALALAIGISGSEEAFVELMNREARRLKLADTQFVNTHGLDAPGHYSTATDLAALGRIAMKQRAIRERVVLRTAIIPAAPGGSPRVLESKNDLLDLDRTADGIKTGHTQGAGYALVARSWRPPSGPLYLALLGSSGELQRAYDAKALLDWGFRQFGVGQLLPAKRPVSEVPVLGTGGSTVSAVATRALIVPLRAGVPVTQRVRIVAGVAPPVERGQRLGVIEFRQGQRVIGRRALVAAHAVDSPSLWGRVTAGFAGVMDFSL